MDALLGVFELASQVHVVHRNLREAKFSCMSVHVGHLLVHIRGVAIVSLGNEEAVLGAVEVVADSAFAQLLRVTILVHKVLWVEECACFGVIDLKLTADKLVVHLGYVRVEGLIGEAAYANDKLFGLVVYLARCLVAKLATNKTAVTLLFILIGFLPEAQCAAGQCVTIEVTQSFNHCTHALPTEFLLKELLRRCCVVVEVDGAV